MAERRTKVLLCRWLLPHHFVVAMTTSLLLSFFCGYAIAVGSEKVNALFPYISDTGTKPPASCVFGLLLNIAAAITVVVVYIRHGYLEKNTSTLDSSTFRMHIINDLSFFAGFLSALGMSVVACFQETNVLTVHLIGALMAFVGGCVYCWSQSYLSLKLFHIGLVSKALVWFRFVLSGCATAFLVMTCVGALVAASQHHSKRLITLNWVKGDRGYAAHLVSTFSEWLMAMSVVGFFMTFYKEFQNVESKIHVRASSQEDGSNDNVVFT